MRTYQIKTPDFLFKQQLQDKIDALAKPAGSLGKLEDIAKTIGSIQHSLTPSLQKPHHLLFVADHGITEESVSPSPKEITWQQALNITQGGAGINIFTEQHNISLMVVDAGTDYDFPTDSGIIDRKVRKSTRNFLHEPALTIEEVELALQYGEEMVDIIVNKGCNVLSIGELGISNTSPAAIWMSLLTNISLNQCVGSGSGFSIESTRYKYEVLQKSIDRYTGEITPLSIMTEFGGLELIMATGAMLRAAELQMTIIIDGFLMSNSFLMAHRLNPNVDHYAIFSHRSNEKGHALLLEYLGVEPLLELHFCLGEGTGATCAYPLLESSVRMLKQMKSFTDSNIVRIKEC